MAETSKFIVEIIRLIECFSKNKFDNLKIIDIGSGDDPLSHFIDTFDLPVPYTKNCNVNWLTFTGDARYIKDIVKSKYDVVYSSHLLEDFDRSETVNVLRNWSELLNIGGILVLLLPDQQKYLERCERIGESPNEHHSINDFSLSYILECLSELNNMSVVYNYEFFIKDPLEYNFLVIATKISKLDGNFAI